MSLLVLKKHTLLFILLICFMSTYAIAQNGFIPADDANFQYTGRIDFTNPKRPQFSYPGISIKAKFQGTSVAIVLKDYASGGSYNTNFYNVIIDKEAPKMLEVNNKDTLYAITTSLKDTIHTIEIFKRTESSVGKSDFRGLVLSPGKSLLPPSNRPTIKFEFIGDSYTCGYGNGVSIPPNGNLDTDFNAVNENNYMAWGAIVSRKLNVEYVCIAASGRGVYRNNNGKTEGVIPSVYEQIILDQATPTWNTAKYTPDVIVLHLGTNDFQPVRKGNLIDEAAFVSAYINFVKKLRTYYPSALIICAVSNGLSDFYPPNANNLFTAKNLIKQVVSNFNSKGDSKVYNFKMTPQGAKGEPYGEDYHPSVETHQIMANDLIAFLNTIPEFNSLKNK
jgi:lysophospholipase L1-like esterase